MQRWTDSTSYLSLPLQHGLACAPSSLNYSCSVASGSVTIHWGLGAAAPTNDCTTSVSPAAIAPGSAGGQMQEQLLHMAIEAPTSGEFLELA